MVRRARQETKSRGRAKESRKQRKRDLAKQLQDKLSQLARFGLDDTRGALLEHKPPPRKGP